MALIRWRMAGAATSLSLGLLAGCGAATSTSSPVTGTASSTSGTPSWVSSLPSTSAVSVQARARIGALFAGSTDHSCTASVISSTNGDLILTAAHCIQGTATNYTFVPGYQDGSRPYGTWQVTAAFVDPAWQKSQPATDDFAVLRVAQRTIDGEPTSIEGVTSGLDVAPTPPDGTEVHVLSYNAGVNDKPVACKARLTSRTVAGISYPEFNCSGYVGGSSGSPWVMNRDGKPWIVGVLGGLDQGGCSQAQSYSAPIGNTLMDLISTAESTKQGMTVPNPPNNC